MRSQARSLATSDSDRLLIHEVFELVQFVVLLELLDEDLVRYFSGLLIGIQGLLGHLLAYLLEQVGYSVPGLNVAGFLMLLGGQGVVVRFLTVIIVLISKAFIYSGKSWR